MNRAFYKCIFTVLAFIICCGIGAAGENSSDGPGRQSPCILGWEKNLYSDYPAVNPDKSINVVVEITAGTNEKWEVTGNKGYLKLQREGGKPRIIQYLGYPGNYGMIPRTIMDRSVGGDGDPLDVIIVGAPVSQGAVVKARIIGVLKLLDKGEKDDKIIAVLPGNDLYNVSDMKDMDIKYPGVSIILETWFLNYKGPGIIKSNGYGSPEEAQDILLKAVSSYEDSAAAVVTR